MGKSISVFHANTPTTSTTAKPDLTGKSIKKMSERLQEAAAEKGAGATVSGRLLQDVEQSETKAYFYVRKGHRSLPTRFWEALTLKDITQRKAATVAVEHLLQRFEDQPDAQQIVNDVRKEMRHSRQEIKAETLQIALDALIEKFDATHGDRKQILNLRDKDISQLAKDTRISKKDISSMRDYVQHRHNLLNGIAAGTPPSPEDVAKFARQVLKYAAKTPHALGPNMRALYFEAKAFASTHPDFMNLRPGMLHTPTLGQEPAFDNAVKLLGTGQPDEDKLDEAAQKLAGVINDQLKENIDRGAPFETLSALFATQGAQYRLELSKALMDAAESQSDKASDPNRAQLKVPLRDLLQRLDRFSAAVLSHVQKGYEAYFDGDSLIEYAADGEQKTWTRDVEPSVADGAPGTSLYRNGKETRLVKEIDAGPDSRPGAAPVDSHHATREVLRHMEINQRAPGLAPDVLVAPSTDGKVRLAMERPAYGNLGQFINSQLRGDVRRAEGARTVCKGVANALNELHQLKMAHGDLRPEDVVLALEDDDVVVKLTNFGAAHTGAFMYAREDEVTSSHRKSPERLTAKATTQNPDGASFSPQKDDVWAFGLMVYRMFSPDGRSAFPESESGLKEALKLYGTRYLQKEFWRGLPDKPSLPREAREFIGWVLNPDPAKRPSMEDVLNHRFLAKGPDQSAIDLIHETGQLQDFLDWGPSDIRQFSADTGIEEVQVRAMIQYLRVGRDDEPEADMPDGDTIAGFVNSFRAFIARPTQAPHASFVLALRDRVEVFATAHPNLVANAPANGANAGGPAIVAAPNSVKGVLNRLGEIKPEKGAKAYGVAPGETVKGVENPQFGVRVRNQRRNVLQRVTDRLTGANVARGKAAQQSVEHLVKRFEDQPGAKEILAKLRSTIRNPRKTLPVAQLANTLTALVNRFDLDSANNTALKEFVGREAADVLDFAQVTGIPEELVAVMQAHLRLRSGLLDGSASKESPSLKGVADFVRRFDQYIREAPTVLTDPAILALEAEVRAFTLSRPDLLDLRAGLVHTPALTEKISFAKAAGLLAQPGKLDPKRAADAAKQLARLIVRSLQDPENKGRDLPMLFSSGGMEYRRELSNALKAAIVEQGPTLRSDAAQSPLRSSKLDARLATFSNAVYAEVLKGLPDYCKGDDVVVESGKHWTKGKALNGVGATADLFVYENGDDTVVVKELKSVDLRFTDSVPIEHFCDFEEARLHRHINDTAKDVAPKLHGVVQSDKGGVRFVMEHAIYRDLASFIETSSGAADSTRNEAAFSLLTQVAENLYELHTYANVGHVDFKPANVLLTRGGGGAVLAQLTDFGASREGKTMFLRDDPVDSPQWKSPERLGPRNGPDAPRFSTHAADVWAFGVTMYQMYAKDGRNPFDRTDFPADIGPKILAYAKGYESTETETDTETPDSTLPFDTDGIHEDYQPIIRWILDPDPVARPTMAEILGRMRKAPPLSVEAHNFIQASVGAEANVERYRGDASGGKTRTLTPPSGEESDVYISSSDAPEPRIRRLGRGGGDDESSSLVESSGSASENVRRRASGSASDSDSLVESSESAPEVMRQRRASGSASDSSAEESVVSEDESQPTGTFRANVVQGPDTANLASAKKAADKP
ncbi:MAG: hypothetical protein JWR21_4185 [Herminiimonas sp.]|nr:hypothetical protein [Herminiimonas sp.]